YDLLGCQPLPVPTFDRIIPYGVGDEHGSTVTLEQAISERLIPNILAGENAGVASRLRELGSNTAARDAGLHRVGPHPFVTVCQAAALVVPKLAHCWAATEAIKSLAATLAKPSAERLKTFEAPVKTALGMEALKAETSRICGEALADI